MADPAATVTEQPRTAAVIEAELNSLPGSNQVYEDDTPTPPVDGPEVALASRRGWVPKSEYTGDPAKWVDAKTFVDRGEKFNHNLQRELALVKKKLEDFEGTKQAFVKFHEETVKKKDVELADTIKQLRLQRSEAISDGQHESAIDLEDKIELLQKERKEIQALPATPPPAETSSKEPGPRADDPVLLEWIEDGNQWFNDDAPLRAYAISIGEDLITKGETIKGRKFLDKVSALMAEEFPRKFAKANPSPTATSRPNPMDGGSNSSSSSSSNNRSTGGKTERDLPDVDLQLMRQFIKEGWTTKEKFLQGYFSS